MGKTYRVKLVAEMGNVEGGGNVSDDTKRAGSPKAVSGVATGAIGGGVATGAIAGGVAAGAVGSSRSIGDSETLLDPTRRIYSMAELGAMSPAEQVWFTKQRNAHRKKLGFKPLRMSPGTKKTMKIKKKRQGAIDKIGRKLKRKEARKGMGLFGKILSNPLVKAAGAIGVVIAGLLALGNTLKKYSAAMAGVMTRFELLKRKFMMKMGDALAPLLDHLINILEIIAPLLIFLAKVIVALNTPIKLLVDVIKAVLEFFGMEFGKATQGWGPFVQGMADWTGVNLDALPGAPGGNGGPGGGAPGGGGGAGGAGGGGGAGAGAGRGGKPIPPRIAPQAPVFNMAQLFLGMNATIETRRAIDAGLDSFRSLLLQDLNKADNEATMFMNELKSLNYVRLV